MLTINSTTSRVVQKKHLMMQIMPTSENLIADILNKLIWTMKADPQQQWTSDN